MYAWLVFMHVLGGFGFLLAHGASAVVAFKLRQERSPERVRALLDLSVSSYSVMYIALLVLLGGGIAAGFVGKWWRMGWIWTAIGLLLAMLVAMGLLGTTHYHRVRKAVGLPFMENWKEQPPMEPASAEELDGLLSTPHAVWLAGIGGGGLTLVLWLMMFKPF